MGIKAIIFDVGGVLELSKSPHIYKHKGYRDIGVHEYISRKLGISVDQWFDSMDTTYAKSVEGKISKNETIEIIARNVGVSNKNFKKIVINAYRKNFKQNKQLFKQAFKLKKLGYKISILSDQWHLSKESLMNDKEYKRFSPVIVSCDVGIRKPNPKIYFLVLRELNNKPSECLFIDNQKWNVDAARKLGIESILFKDNKQLFENRLWKELWK